jgi:hypothetical protein
MRIGGSGAAWANQSNAVGNWQQRQQNMRTLGSALQSGDLAGAQQAFATISASNPAAAANGNGPLAKIGQALQAGDLATAQQAAQAWRGTRNEGSGGQWASSATSSSAKAAASTFLQTLTPVATTATSATAATDASCASASSDNAAGTATSDQIAQALDAFEKNLFASLQAQFTASNASSGATTSGATSAATPTTDPAATATASTTTDPTQTSSTATPGTATASATTSASTTPMQGRHHHHHGGGGSGDAQLQAGLSSLIGQTAATASATTADGAAATAPATTAAAGTAALDQSFKNLLSTLGVSGNNASLNTFLQAMSASMQSNGTASDANSARV